MAQLSGNIARKERDRSVMEAIGGKVLNLRAFRRLARENAPAALERLMQIIKHGEDAVALQAIRELLDRGFGRASLNLTMEEDVQLRAMYGQLRSLSEVLEARNITPQLINAPTIDAETVDVP